MGRPLVGCGFGKHTDYDIRLKADGIPILFTWYKGHKFDGWISNENFRKAEADGVLAWDTEGNPMINGDQHWSTDVPLPDGGDDR